MNHLILQGKFLDSRKTLNTDRLSDFVPKMKRQFSQVFINPYPTKHLLKFPKNKNVRRQTLMSTIVESTHNPEKSTIRTNGQNSKTTLNFDKAQKRIAKYGQYNPLASSKSAQKLSIQPKIRTFGDLGINKNMKKVEYSQKYKTDCVIVCAENTATRHLNKVWNQPRKIRDNGSQLKQALIWKVEPTVKKSLYNKSIYSSLHSSSVSFIDMLNYNRRT